MSNANKQSSKTEIQRAIDVAQSRRDELQKRRDEIVTQSDGLSQSIEARTRAMGEGLLNRIDPSKETDSLSRDKAKLEAFKEGIRQADEKLRLLDQEIQDKHLGLKACDFYAVQNGIDELVLLYKSLLHDAAKVEREIAQSYGTLEQMSGAELQRDYPRAVRTLFMALSLELEQKLARVEAEYAKTIQEISEKSGST